MPDKPIKELLTDVIEKANQIHQGLYGVAGTDDKGMSGDLKELVKQVTSANGKRAKLEIKYWCLIGFLGGTGLLEGFEIIDIF